MTSLDGMTSPTLLTVDVERLRAAIARIREGWGLMLAVNAATLPKIPTDAFLPTPEVVRVTRVKYRQIDYWHDRGYIHAAAAVRGSFAVPGSGVVIEPRAGETTADVARHPGSGSTRLWALAEVEVIRLMGVLVRAGIAPAVAVGLARQISETGAAALAPGLAVVDTRETPR